MKTKIMYLLQVYMGGTLQHVKKQKSGIFTPYNLDFLDDLHFFALMKITMVFKHLGASIVISCDS